MQIRPLTGITLKTVVVDNIAQKIGEEDTIYHFVNGGWEKTEKDEFFSISILMIIVMEVYLFRIARTKFAKVIVSHKH
ncbi:hypothetical protein SRCM100169_02209 [Bacillus siamensis]|nr:hypothetical protein SRCM100169_02209 [Bacillus siamensis]